MNLKDAGIYDLNNIFKGIPTTAHSKAQGGIISNNPRLINIPAYQRPYRWDEDRIEQLFIDYDENKSEYFLGSAVFVERKKEEKLEFDVVDGQQRITTLFLLNYIRYLLKREYYLHELNKPHNWKASEYCDDLKNTYVNLIGKTETRFSKIANELEALNNDTELELNERVERLLSCYKTELCIADPKSTPQETKEEIYNKAKEFFKDEQLCLKYSRTRYDAILRDALCNVYLRLKEDTNNFELCNIIEDTADSFSKNYLVAMKKIFSCIWERAKMIAPDTADQYAICEKAITFSNKIIDDMSLCIVLTENEADANKLFEVLNDRSLAVDDLELVKNHFYKEYCIKSADSDDVKDQNITKLDELWVDKIFSNTGDKKTKYISYFGAVYLTCDKELAYKEDSRLKDAIDKSYTSQYSKIEKQYTYEEILSDFNAYLAMKIILEESGFRFKDRNAVSLQAEQEDKSITYKSIHLLNAMEYFAVIPAITNMIVAVYRTKKSMTSPNFEVEFKEFIHKVFADTNNSDAEYQKIHKCSYVLWVAALKSKDFNQVRLIAKRFIEGNGRELLSGLEPDFLGSEINILNDEFDKWVDAWNYGTKKDFSVKVLLLNLLLCERDNDPAVVGYKRSKVKLNTHSALAYKLDAGKLQLDHLEANVFDPSNSDRYFMASDKETRGKLVNGYLGNFMILDAEINNVKNNVPLIDAMKFYKKIDKSWLITDINDMLTDSSLFDTTKQVPKEDLFATRSKHLKKYFFGLLNKPFNKNEFEVDL